MSKTKIPANVARRTTHHICDCKQWQIEQMATALRIVRTWAACDEFHDGRSTRREAMEEIAVKCDEALESIEVSR